MSYEKEMPANVTKEVDGKCKEQGLSRMSTCNKSKIESYQKESGDNRVGVPVIKYTE